MFDLPLPGLVFDIGVRAVFQGFGPDQHFATKDFQILYFCLLV